MPENPTTLESATAPFARIYDFLTATSPEAQVLAGTEPYGSRPGEMSVGEHMMAAPGLVDIPGLIGEEAADIGGLPPLLGMLMGIGVPGPEDIAKAPKVAKGAKELIQEAMKLEGKTIGGSKIIGVEPGHGILHAIGPKGGKMSMVLGQEEGVGDLLSIYGKKSGDAKEMLKDFEEINRKLGTQGRRGQYITSEEGRKSFEKARERGLISSSGFTTDTPRGAGEWVKDLIELLEGVQ